MSVYTKETLFSEVEKKIKNLSPSGARKTFLLYVTIPDGVIPELVGKFSDRAIIEARKCPRGKWDIFIELKLVS